MALSSSRAARGSRAIFPLRVIMGVWMLGSQQRSWSELGSDFGVERSRRLSSLLAPRYSLLFFPILPLPPDPDLVALSNLATVPDKMRPKLTFFREMDAPPL